MESEALMAEEQRREARTRKRKAKAAAKKAAKAKLPPQPNDWDTLRTLIGAYANASIGESWKGGGDPLDFEVLELRLKLAEMELNNHISRMQEALT